MENTLETYIDEEREISKRVFNDVLSQLTADRGIVTTNLTSLSQGDGNYRAILRYIKGRKDHKNPVVLAIREEFRGASPDDETTEENDDSSETEIVSGDTAAKRPYSTALLHQDIRNYTDLNTPLPTDLLEQYSPLELNASANVFWGWLSNPLIENILAKPNGEDNLKTFIALAYKLLMPKEKEDIDALKMMMDHLNRMAV